MGNSMLIQALQETFENLQDQRVIREIVKKCSKISILLIKMKILYSHLMIKLVLGHTGDSMRNLNYM